MNAHLLLVGLSGSGKSTVGPIVAERLQRPFLDLDREIERREGSSISQIFSDRGERYFRRLERQVTEELRDRVPAVVATGAGWITNPALVAMVRPPSELVYLRVIPEVALARLGASSDRPLLSVAEPLKAIRRQCLARHVLYEASDHKIDGATLTPSEIAEAIVRARG